MTFSTRIELVKSAGKCQEGQTMAEYAVVIGVIIIAIVLAIGTLSGGVANALDNVTGII